MAKLKDKMDASEKRIVKVAMRVGRFPIRSASHEWVNATTKVKHPGIALHMAGIDQQNPKGYAELDLDKPADLEAYNALVEMLEDGSDPRLKANGIRIIPPDSVAAPFPWWDTTSARDLLLQVERGIRAMPMERREGFLKQCVRYEQQQETPRKGLVKNLLEMELDGASDLDPLTPEVPVGN